MTPITGSDPLPAGTRRAALAVFGVLVLISLLFFDGRLRSSDEIVMAATSHSIIAEQTLRFPQPLYEKDSSPYGIIGPVTALPLTLLDRALLSDTDISLLPLLNTLLFGLTGVFVFIAALRLMPAEARSLRLAGGMSAAVVAASPLLPLSTTFYSEPYAAAALTGLLCSMLGPPTRGHFALAFVCAAAALLARFSTLPLVVLMLAWQLGRDRRSLIAASAGAVAGFLLWMLVNLLARGNPFDTGYGHQEFSTPLLTGLFGHLISSERGLLVFFPLVVFALGSVATDSLRSVRRLGFLLLGFTLVFHATYWVWHAGWTPGPRFLVPALAVLMPVLVARAPEVIRARPLVRIGALAALLWGMWGAVIHSLFSAMDWWNDLSSFHQLENRWLFEPQLSLWAGWDVLAHDGALRALIWDGLAELPAPATRPALVFLVFVLLASGLRFVLPKAARLVPSPAMAFRELAAAAGLLTLLVLGLLSGPRGFISETATEGTPTRPRVLRVSIPAGETVRYSALADLYAPGTYTWQLKAEGSYAIRAGGELLFLQEEPLRRHLGNATLEVPVAGTQLLEITASAPPDSPGMLNLYWTWPGQGRLLEPVGGEYVLPRQLSAAEGFASRIWRKKWLLAAGWLALVLLLPSAGRAKPSKPLRQP